MKYKNLKALREGLNMTQEEFARTLSIGKTTYNGYETGARDPKSDFWVSVAKKYGVTVDYLMGFSDTPYQTSCPPENAPSIPDAALKVAVMYQKLDRHGKEMVDVVLEKESARMAEEASRQDREEFHPAPLTQMPKAKKRRDGFVEIRVYDQPAAAGLGNYLDEPDFHIEQYPKDVIPDQTDFGIIISGDSMEPKVHDHATAFVQSCVSIDPGQIGIFILNATAYCKKLSINRETRQVRLVSVNEAYDDIIIQESDDFRTVGLVLGQWLPKQYR